LLTVTSFRNKTWYVTDGPQNPVAAVVGTFTNTAAGLITDCRELAKDLSSSPQVTVEALGDSHSDSTTPDTKLTTPPTSKSKRSAFMTFGTSVIGHSLKAPVAFFYNLANGFHNCPTVLLSDRTVRSYPPITGLASGLARSGKELGFGLFDAVTGLVVQPYRGYKDAGDRKQAPAVGIAKGIGRGFGGLVLKTGAAVTGIPGYSFKGLEREIERWWQGSDVFLHGETEILTVAKDQVNNRAKSEKHERTRVEMMWDDSKGAGMGKRIVERRVWQGYRELNEMKKREDAKAFEQDILDRWDRMMASPGAPKL
jgi:hypothetical protein